MIQRIVKLWIITFIVTLLLGCDQANKTFVEVSKTVDRNVKTVNDIKKDRDTSAVVKVHKGFYSDTKPVDLEKPAWLNRYVSFKGQNVPLSFVLERILRDTKAIVSYSGEMQSNKVVSMNYAGDIRGALNNLAIQIDYAYTIEGDQIVWSDFVTKTLNISFMPGSSTYSVGNSGSQQSSTARGEATAISTLNDTQSSMLKGNLSVWNDLKDALNNLKSKDGTISVSEATTTIMVHDHPSNVRAIENYIKQLNREMSRVVELRIKVLQMMLNEDHQFGIDWELAQRAINTSFGLNGDMFSNISITSSSGISASSPLALTIGNRTGSHAIIKALGQQGKVSVITEPTVTTLNNQIAEVRITRDTSYLQQSEMSMATEGSTSNSITPGVVTDGFTLYVLPKIEGKNIYLQISSAFSILQGIHTINNLGQQDVQVDPSQSSGQSIITIQVPSISERRFNMRSSVRDGETLIIAGYKQLDNEVSTSSMFGSTALGARGVGKTNSETILLITPKIIENDN